MQTTKERNMIRKLVTSAAVLALSASSLSAFANPLSGDGGESASKAGSWRKPAPWL
jgi:hypothetical protein